MRISRSKTSGCLLTLSNLVTWRHASDECAFPIGGFEDLQHLISTFILALCVQFISLYDGLVSSSLWIRISCKLFNLAF